MVPDGNYYYFCAWGSACKSCFLAGTIPCKSVCDLSALLCGDLGVSQGVVASPRSRSNTGAEVQAP